MNVDELPNISSFSPPDTLYENCQYDGDELVCPKTDGAGW